jgi:hypothetical protein
MKAKEYLSSKGYGSGTNYTTDSVAGLMEAYHKERLRVEEDETKECKHFILKEYLTQPYGTCSICGAFVTGL